VDFIGVSEKKLFDESLIFSSPVSKRAITVNLEGLTLTCHCVFRDYSSSKFHTVNDMS
jgi:hypothetical protein